MVATVRWRRLVGIVTACVVGIKAVENVRLRWKREKELSRAIERYGALDSMAMIGADGSSARHTRHSAVVIGAGVAGITSAYELARQGYSVLVLDAAAKVSSECSAAPAGGMQKMNPNVDSSMFLAVLKSFLPRWSSLFRWRSGSHEQDEDHGNPEDRPRQNSRMIARQNESVNVASAGADQQKMVKRERGGEEAFQFFRISLWNTLTDVHFLRWFVWYAYSSVIEDACVREYRQRHMLAFTCWAIDDLISLMKHSHFGTIARKAGLVQTGALKLLDDPEEFQALLDRKAENKPIGWSDARDMEPTELIDRAKLFSMEPWLARSRHARHLVGAIFQTQAASANCESLTEEVAKIAVKKHGVQIELNTHVTGFREENSTIVAIETSRGEILVDENVSVVVCAGSWTPVLLRKLNLFVPLYPLKGYNIVMNSARYKAHDVPKRIIADKWTYATHFHNELRVTSIGELNGWCTDPDPNTVRSVRSQATALFPELATPLAESSKVVCGLRPFVFDGVMLTGKVRPFENLYVNAGPGFNGWKCASGAAKLLAASVMGNAPSSIPIPRDFDAAIFDPNGRIVYSRWWCWLASLWSAQ
ncbi:D-amino acid dehydrogenase [Porphyridium purpureum]|uniref:FAD-dependent oxidoreductase domain-containing protein 1 n=1 Tax=Porphyridium purpureum TaxID=35688 RepID=A0A5J4YM11_PORPP|nr:D-amino acid dehydrogenase [Porphyridium purpureum]|eukprot:POR1165..scf249_10